MFNNLIFAVNNAQTTTKVGRIEVVPIFSGIDQPKPTTVRMRADGRTIATIEYSPDFFGITGGIIYINAEAATRYVREINAVLEQNTAGTYAVRSTKGKIRLATKREPLRWFAELC